MSRNKILMIVDDDVDDCEFFCEALQDIDSSAECIIAVDGEDALIKLRNGMEKLPEFIFLDLNMPRMDGRTCLAELKKDEQLQNIPVIIFSTSSYQKDIDETRELGAAYFVTKPAEFDALRKEIAFVLEENFLKNKNGGKF